MQPCDTRPPPPPKITGMVFRAPRGSCISCSGSGWLVPCCTEEFNGFCGVQPDSLSLGCQVGGHQRPETLFSPFVDAVALQTLLLYNKE